MLDLPLIFWNTFRKTLGTQLHFSTAFAPQSNGQTGRLNQVLEDMLRAYVMDFTGCWDEHLPLSLLIMDMIASEKCYKRSMTNIKGPLQQGKLNLGFIGPFKIL